MRRQNISHFDVFDCENIKSCNLLHRIFDRSLKREFVERLWSMLNVSTMKFLSLLAINVFIME